MSQIPGSLPPGSDHKIFEKNIQHMGQSSEGVSKKEKQKLASADDGMNAQDSVSISGKGRKSAEHTGSFPRISKKKESVETPKAMPQELSAEPQLDLLAGLPEKGPLAMSAEPPANTPPPANDPGAPPTEPPANTPPMPTPASDAAQRAKQMQDDMQAAQTIYMQMAADRQKWLMEMWKIIQDTQTAIFQIIQSVVLQREKVSMECAEKWAAVLGGYAR